MNTDIFQGKWKQIKGRAREAWGALTDDDLDKAEGDREQLVGVIQERYGKAREDAEREVDEFLAKFR
ncbi:CsbD family protein [Rhodovulum sulfidophilum]|uniref:CsbD family protein n=1 Tax=Rhodovulum sulfidophilum TaxID=35806 RepID=A0A0D6AXE6_RHOSU|nr:CsbD family protein [Rhodovulum sulfidophilum]